MENLTTKNGFNRRDFLKAGGMSTLALTLGSTGILSIGSTVKADASNNPASGAGGYGPLVPDPNGIMDLPKGFHYKIISEEGGQLTNGTAIPGAFDGMAAFEGPKNTTILVRNHELSSGAEHPVVGRNPYDPAAAGGTTTLVIDNARNVIKEYVTSSGTIRNCAGGATLWGTWLTCEETRTATHGYVFEVDPQDPENEMSRTPIKDMGRFSHEACAIDPATGYVYLTEDATPSYLYRFIPNDTTQKPGALQKGGKLYAAAIEEISSPSASTFKTGQKIGIVWKELNPELCREDAKAQGCIEFKKLEGAFFQAGVFWFDDSSAGAKNLGRIYRYIPSTNTLELFYEATDAQKMESPDNICMTPWGDLWFAEDGSGNDRIMGITPEGEIYPFASNRLSGSELAGPIFSPDGKTLFVNIQSPGKTFAIWGPFARSNSARAREMSYATPSKHFAPQVSDKLVKFAENQGISVLEAAAFERHGLKI
ncbi:secreted PhoX family phosphatase [Peribacillus deserti]|uniref:Secreted PhoX family phosphatase n=1 Tax=Peribacillus deserti TaxID=673318 RepID=A0ABS2QI67_9BACI|nr:alkaline phosphatase PhoX [Peribacillus deserti]MBM7692213.1 secreted PhoX family phosphatase [Peribacillus deserti]